jgi:hypothetical protein
VDFIAQTKNQYHYFGLGLTLMGVTALTYYYDMETMTEKDSVCHGKKYWYENPILAIIPAHAIQFLAVTLVIFKFKVDDS